MGNNSTTYTINFKAQYESLTKLESELTKIQKQSGELNLTGKEQEHVQHLILKLQELKQLTEQKMDDGHLINVEDFKEIERIFNKLLTQANNFSSALINMLPEDLATQIKDLKQQIDELNKANQKLGAAKGISTKTFNKQANAIAMEEIQRAGPMANIADENGNLITTYAELKQRAEQLAQANRELTQEEQQVLEVWAQVDSRVQPIMEAWITQWNALTAEIEANRLKISELLATMNALQNAEDNTSQPLKIDPQSLATYQQYVGAINQANQALTTAKTKVQEHNKEVATGTTTQARHQHQTDKTTVSYEKNRTALGKAVHNVVSYGSALTLVRGVYTRLIQTITEMDKALTGMTVVTQLSREQAWELTSTMQELAKQTGMTSTEIANMTTMYLQQGKTLADSLELTEAAAKAARIAGISGAESINLLTNAMNGFQLAADQAMEVSDKFAALAAAAATDYEELATALSKVAAQANLAGMSMDFTLGLLTKGIEVTREAPETIGTALKTVISRMRELNDYGETLEDGIDVNRVASALSVINVDLLDQNREFRDLELVLTEVGEKWDTLTVNQQANVAVALAGTRQQSRLIAMMQDFDRTQQLINISMKSAGATAAQHRKYMQGLEAATTKLTTSYQQLITNFMNSDAVIGVINTISSALEFLSQRIELVGGALAAITMAYIALNKEQLLNKAITLVEGGAKMMQINSTKSLTNAVGKLTTAFVNARIATLEATIADMEKAGADAAQIALLKAEKKSLEQLTGEQVENSVAQVANVGASAANSAGLLGMAGAATVAKYAVDRLTEAIKKNWVLLLVAAVVALAAAWYSANKETEEAQRLTEVIGELFQSLGHVLSPLMKVLGVILELLMGITTVIVDVTVPILEAVGNVVRMIAWVFAGLAEGISDLVEWFKSLGEVGGWVGKVFEVLAGGAFGGPMGLITGIVEAISPGAIQRWGEAIDSWFQGLEFITGSAEEKASLTADAIADLQETAYDNRQLSDTLTPLIDEYEELNKKAIKTTEDIERMQEIEQEVGGLNQSYLTANGRVNLEVVKAAQIEADAAAQAAIEEAYNKAIGKYGIQTGVVKDEFRAAITDYYAEQTRLSAEAGEMSTQTANAIANNFQQMINNMSDAELQRINNTVDGYKNMYSSVAQFEKEQQALIEDTAMTEEERLNAQMKAYQQHLATVPDDAKAAFNSIYSLYATYAQMINQLALSGAETTSFLSKMASLGLTQDELLEIIEAYKSQYGGSDQDAMAWIANAVYASDGTNVAASLINQAFAKAGGSDDHTLINAIEKGVTQSNQEITEAYAKAISKSDTLAEMSKKMAAGELTPDEIRKLESEYPEIFSSEMWEQFKTGNFDPEAYRQAAIDSAMAAIDARLALSTLSETERKVLEAEKEALQYAHLFSSQLWTDMAKNTAELVEQERIQGRINKLNEELQGILDPSVRSAKTQELLNEYAAMRRVYSHILDDERYNTLINEGYLVDGKLTMTASELKMIFENDPEMWKFLDSYADVLEDATEANNTYLQGLRDVVEQEYNNQIQALEQRREQYEAYWDRLDAFEQEQERVQSRDSIISQLSALAGGSDAASNNLRKDLLSQLADINKEEAEARKQEIRDNLLDSIDSNIDDINEGIEQLNTTSKEGLIALLNGFGFDIPAFAKGGLVNFTGPAWVDGSKANPEAFLDATDTKLIAQLVQALHYGGIHTKLDADGSALGAIVIENLNITTNELNNEQDFRSSGHAFADEFAKAIRQRGINVNVKR